MPVSPPFTWEEVGEVEVNINVSLSGLSAASTKALDVFSSDCFLKINFPPALLMIDLFDYVDDLKSKTIVKPGRLTVVLHKLTPGSWGRLKAVGSKKSIKKRRSESIQAKEQQMEEAKKGRKTAAKEENEAIQKAQWAEEDKKRGAIQSLKEKERIVELNELNSWSKKFDNNCNSDATSTQPSQEADDDKSMDGEEKTEEKIEDQVQEIWNEDEEIDTDYQPIEAQTVLPPVRKAGGKIEIKFTPRATGAPAREDEDYKREEATRRNKRGIPTDKVDLSQQHPIFLKETADKLCASGDWDSAIRAYSKAIFTGEDPSGTLIEIIMNCHSNRAAAFLKLASCSDDTVIASSARAAVPLARGRLRSCVIDCSKAMNFVSKLKESKLDEEKRRKLHRIEKKLLLRRATACSWLGKHTQALADWERVLNLQVEWRKREERIQVQEGGSVAAEDVMLREEAYFGAEIERLSTLLAAIKDGRSNLEKRLGDKAFASGNPQEARNHYSLSLSLDPSLVAAFSNRAAASLALADYKAVVVDCCCAMALLDDRGGNAFEGEKVKADASLGKHLLAQGLGEDTQESKAKRIKMRTKLLARRGAAYCWLQQFSSAKTDLAEASSLEPTNAPLKTDLANITKHIQARSFLRKSVAAYKSGHYEHAIYILTQALTWHADAENLVDGNVNTHAMSVLLSNRAACFLSTADYEKCVQDCNRSIALQKQCEEFPTSYLPWALPKDFQETECARLTLIRKGTGNAWMGNLKAAKDDYTAALSYFTLEQDPQHEYHANYIQLRNDVERISQRLAEQKRPTK